MFRTRLISGIILVILIIGFIFTGGYVLSTFLLALSMIGSFELMRVFDLHKSPLMKLSFLTVIAYYILFNLVILTGRRDFGDCFSIFVICLIILYLCVYVFGFEKLNGDQIIKALFTFLYVPFMLYFILLTRSLPGGIYIVWLIFLSSWGADTCAYCVGMLFGKHKMSPVLSPKKSVEGAVGGIVGTMILTLIYFHFFGGKMGIEGNLKILLVALSGVAAFVSMIGDLAASAFKRNYNIKDYGKLIPGHGGVLDRFDSVIITAPIIYILGLIIS